MSTKKLLLTAIALFASNVASADIACQGVPSNVRLWTQGDAWVSISYQGSNNTWLLCKYNETYDGITPEQCKATYTTALTALMGGHTVSLGFHNYASCSDIPSWDGSVPGNLWNITILSQ